MLEANEMKVLRKTVCKTNLDTIRTQKNREFCDIHHFNKWVERRRGELNEHERRMNAERLVKISRDNKPTG